MLAAGAPIVAGVAVDQKPIRRGSVEPDRKRSIAWRMAGAWCEYRVAPANFAAKSFGDLHSVSHDRTTSMSRAKPRGPVALPRASRQRAFRNVSSGQPNWSARLAAIAASDAMIP